MDSLTNTGNDPKVYYILLSDHVVKNYWWNHKQYRPRSDCFKAQKVPNEIVKFFNSVDPDEVAHHEPPHLNLHCFLFNL